MDEQSGESKEEEQWYVVIFIIITSVRFCLILELCTKSSEQHSIVINLVFSHESYQ